MIKAERADYKDLYKSNPWAIKLIDFYQNKRGYLLQCFKSNMSKALFFISRQNFAGAGFIDIEESEEVFRSIMNSGETWLKKNEASKCAAPINFNTWYEYRLVSGMFENTSFPSENLTKKYLKEYFESSGYSESEKYHSYLIKDLKKVLESLKNPTARFLSKGGEVFEADKRSFALYANELFQISRSSFKNARFYSDINSEEFFSVYIDSPKTSESRLTLAKYKDKIIGFLLCYFDKNEIAMKTIAVLNEHKEVLAATALISEAYTFALNNGFSKVYHAYMRSGISTHSFSKIHGELYRDYSLYEKEL